MINSVFIKNLFNPPRCAGCGERLDIFNSESVSALCLKCRSEWEKLKCSRCGGCGFENVACNCSARFVKNVTILSVSKFGKKNSVDRFVYALKRTGITKFFDFAVDELCRRLRKEEKLYLRDFSKAIFTNVPRSLSARIGYGYDHAELLARGVAERMGAEYRELLCRSKRSKKQKKLNIKERQKNVKNSFSFNSNEDIFGGIVVLVDDVVTTGATASACIKELRSHGAGEVILLSLVRTDKKLKIKKGGV